MTKHTQHTPRLFPTLDEFKAAIARTAERIRQRKTLEAQQQAEEVVLDDEEEIV